MNIKIHHCVSVDSLDIGQRISVFLRKAYFFVSILILSIHFLTATQITAAVAAGFWNVLALLLFLHTGKTSET